MNKTLALIEAVNPEAENPDNPILIELAEKIQSLDIQIEPSDLVRANPDDSFDVLLLDTLGYRGHDRLGHMLQKLARSGQIVAYHANEGEPGDVKDLAYCGWPLWQQWIREDPAVEHLRETFSVPV